MKTIKKIQISPTAYANTVQAEPCCGSVRVSGWICADNMESGLEAGRLFGGLFGHSSSGGFSMDGTFTDFPFSFDVVPTYDVRRGRMEQMDEILTRVEKVLRNAQRNLLVQRNKKLKALESGAFQYLS